MALISKVKEFFSRTSSQYSIASIWSTGATMISGLIMIRWLTPFELGTWQSVSLFMPYTKFLGMGVDNGLNRELPFLQGQGEIEKAKQFAQSAFAYSLFQMGTIGIISIGVVIWAFKASLSTEIIWAIIGVVLTLFINPLDRYLTVTYRSSQSFLSLSHILWVNGIASIGLLFLVYFYKYYGLIVYNVLNLFISAGLKYWKRPLKIEPFLDRYKLIDLIKTGFPVFVLGYIREINQSFNRIIILAFSTVTMVGLFTPVMAIRSFNVFPSILGNYFFPKMSFQFGEKGDRKLLWPLVLRLNRILFGMGLLLCLGTWVVIPEIIPILFPKYLGSIRAAQIMSISFLFAGTLVSHNVMYVVKDYPKATLFSILESTLLFGLPFLCVQFLGGNILVNISIGVVLAQALLFGINLLIIRKTLFIA